MSDLQRWNIEYEKGYFQAILDISKLCNDDMSRNFKSKKAYQKFILSGMNLLLTDSYVRDIFMQTKTFPGNSLVTVKVKPDGTVFADYHKEE